MMSHNHQRLHFVTRKTVWLLAVIVITLLLLLGAPKIPLYYASYIIHKRDPTITAEHENRSTVLDYERLGPIVAMTNYGNIDFAMNWIKSLRRVRMAKWYMFATDDRTLEELQRRVGPQDTHKVYRLPTSIHSELENNKGEHYKYRSEGWTKLMQSVPRFIKWLLFEKIRGPILYSDTDIVWIEHPYSAFPANPDKFDLIASVDGRVFEDNPRECPQYGSFCGGLMHLQNNIKIEKLLDDWLSHIMKMADGKNQPAYNVAISENRRHAGLVVHTLDCAAYVNGWRAFCLDIVSKKKKFTCQFDWSGYQNRSPVMLHATYTVGAELKIERLKRKALWKP